jgi:cytochrome P450
VTRDFPIGASATLAELEADPHPLLARLREHEPVSWIPALGGWLVTRRDLAMQVMRDPGTFTVDDERFSTGQVVGPSMLTLDGEEHRRHRAPFAAPFRLAAVRERFTEPVAEETDRLLDGIEAAGEAELRRELAGPLAAAIVTHALGLQDAGTREVLGWYDAIVASVTEITAGKGPTEAGARGFDALRAALEPALDRAPDTSLLAAAAGDAAGGLERREVISNAAVMLFGGIETTEGMIANAITHLLVHPDELALVRAEPALLANAIEESLRLEPAAAVVDRYATADVELAGARIRERELVTVSIAGANRDPAVFPDPDRFEVRRENAKLHAAFAHGPHVCIGMHLARLEAHTAVARVLERLRGLALAPGPEPAPRGLVFRKPDALRVRWTAVPAIG